MVNSVAFSPDGRWILTLDSQGMMFVWRHTQEAQLRGLYRATYEVGAMFWQDATHLLLADTGGSRRRPHLYRLQLEGEWDSSEEGKDAES